MKYDFVINHNFVHNHLELEKLNLVQIGRVFCNETFFCDNHYHVNWYELTIITDGEGVIYANNQPTPIKKGDIYFSCMFENHKIETSKENPLKYDFFSFHPTDKELAEHLQKFSNSANNLSSRVFSSEKISFLVNTAIHELTKDKDDFTLTAINSICLQILIYLIRVLNKVKPQSPNPNDKEILCFQIMEYITSNIYNIKKIGEISLQFGYSYNYLSSLFKKTTGNTVIEFYNRTRLNVSKGLIQETSLSLSKIAKKLNFSTVYSFSNSFKKQFGISPSNYKNSLKKQ
ncbi:MAG: helix-turn-helix transcriptional regulator [Clostridia bacterium]|nr:helix-turn-helix transcriptional regulator [Clostridia bacterium]